MEDPRFASADEFKHRLEECDRWEHERKRVETQLVLQYEHLKKEYRAVCQDLRTERESRRNAQDILEQYENEMLLEKTRQETSPFVLVLIDGDGAVFHEHLYARGKQGGEEAARLLLADVRAYLTDRYMDDRDVNVNQWNILVQVVLNQEGLGKKLYSLNMVSQGPPDVQAFGIAFGITQPLFSFIDVGSGKEMADYKVREMLRAMVRVPQCKHVIFGPSHDNGYIPVLQQYKNDQDVAQKLTLLETLPALPGFIELGFRRARFESVFREENLPNRPPGLPFGTLTLNGAPSVPRVNSIHSVHSPSNGGSTPVTNGVAKMPPLPPTVAASAPAAAAPAPPAAAAAAAAAAAVGSAAPGSATTIGSASPAASSPEGSWAMVGKSNIATGHTIDIATTKRSPRKYIWLNRYDERMDQPLPPKEPQAERRLHDKMKGGKFCNKYHISGKCDVGKTCEYNHGERLPPNELNVLRHKARGIRCTQGFFCRDMTCFVGHHCKFSAAGQNCSADGCHFKDTHSSDYRNAKRLYDDGQEEWIV